MENIRFGKIVLDTINYVDSNSKDGICISSLSKALCYDKSHLMRTFKHETGITIIGYANMKKIHDSIPLLLEDNKILKVALLSGFSSLEYYSETFQKCLGCSPSDFRKIFLSNFSVVPEGADLESIKNNLNGIMEQIDTLHKDDVKTIKLVR